jgi:outer membrane protein OmpA-like peptidoglycan-associated protein
MAGDEEARVLDHVRLTVAVLLALLLLLLWWRGYGPYSSAACCAGETGAGVSTPVKTPAGAPLPPAVTVQPSAAEAPPAAIEAEAPATIETQAPSAEVPPAAVEAPAPAAEAPQTAAESPAAEPPYTLIDPNAQVRTDPVSLPPWEGPRPPAFEHEVYVPPPAPDAEPPYTISEPNRQVRTEAVQLPRWEGPQPPLYEHEVYMPPGAPEPGASEGARAEAPEEAQPEALAPAAIVDEETEASTAPSPAYVIDDPNAQVRTAPSTLPAWAGPRYAEPHHEVYYPPAVAPAAEATPAGTGDLPPAARLYFDTAKWDLPADADEVLAPIVRYLQEHPEARAVIQGFHDPRGSQELNAALAKNRAGATWAALVAAGVARERIILRQPGDTTGSGSLSEARRAEVRVVGQ